MAAQRSQQSGCATGFSGFLLCSLFAGWLWSIASNDSPCGSIFNAICTVCVDNSCSQWSGPSSFVAILAEVLIIPLLGAGLACLLYPFHKESVEPGQILQALIVLSIPVTFALAAIRYWWERGVDHHAHAEAYITLEISSGLMLLALSVTLLIVYYAGLGLWRAARRSR